MIDVFGLAGNAVNAINPRFDALVKYSTGTTKNPDFTTTPTFSTTTVQIEVQAVSTQDLQQIENLNQQADMRTVYIYGATRALSRPFQIGGDVLVFYGFDWLVTQQLEEWGDGEWSKVLVTRQLTTS